MKDEESSLSTFGQPNAGIYTTKWIALFFLLLTILAVSCARPPDESETVEVEPETTSTSTPPPVEIIVTRIVEQSERVPILVATPEAERELIELDIGISQLVSTLDPQVALAPVEIDLIQNLFAGLTRLNEKSQEIEPILAESWEVSEDGLTWTFKLREDIPWIRPIPTSVLIQLLDQPELEEIRTVRPVIADDIVFAVRRACDPETNTPNAFVLYIIEGCESINLAVDTTEVDITSIGATAIDPFTIEFRLTEPASYFLTLTSLPIMRPVPAEFVTTADFGEDWSLPEDSEFITNGPFLIEPSTIFGTRIVLVRNPFWPHNGGGNVDLINFYQFDSENDSFESWSARDIDIAPLPSTQRAALIDQSPQKIQFVADQAVFYTAFNYDSQVFRTPELRRAFSAAIDRERIIEEVYDGLGIPARHFTPPGIIGSPAVDVIGVGFDPDLARQQLIASGITACRFLPEIRYMVGSSDASLFQAELIRDMWVEVLGCPKEQIIIEQVQFGTLLANTRPEAGVRRPDVFDLGWASYYPDAHNWFNTVLHCENSDNRIERECDVIDETIEQASTADMEMRQQLYRSIERDLFGSDGDSPIAPIYVRGNYILRQTWVVIEPSSSGGNQYDRYLVDWELKKIEKQQ